MSCVKNSSKLDTNMLCFFTRLKYTMKKIQAYSRSMVFPQKKIRVSVNLTWPKKNFRRNNTKHFSIFSYRKYVYFPVKNRFIFPVKNKFIFLLKIHLFKKIHLFLVPNWKHLHCIHWVYRLYWFKLYYFCT